MLQDLHTLLHRCTIFWLLWSSLTFAAVICTAWIFRASPLRKQRVRNFSRDTGRDWSRGTVISLAVLAIFFVAYSFMILAWENFNSYDESEIAGFSARGIDYPVKILPGEGRFFPLGLQEFNVLRHFTTTPTGFHAFSIAQVLLLGLILVLLDDQLSIAGRVFLIGCSLLAPSIVVSFMGLEFPERNVVLMVACLAISVTMFERTHSRWWAAAAVASSQVMLYEKEPVFLLLLGFAAARLILRNRSSTNPRWNMQRLWDEENRLDLCLIALSLAFLAFYALMMFPHTSAGYLVANHRSLAQTVRYYLGYDWLAWIFAIVAVVRSYYIFARGVMPSLLWDALACGGVVYFGAYLALRMANTYYLAPVDFIAVLYLGHLLFSSWGRMRPHFRIAAAALAALVLYLNLSLSAHQIFERKYFVHTKAQIASLILKRYQRDPRLVQKLSFPYSQPWVLSDFLFYLDYLGLPLEDGSGESKGGGKVQISGGKAANNGRCWQYVKFVCQTGDAAEMGNLVVVLPDDDVLPREQNLPSKSAHTLLSYDPREHVPTLLRKLLNQPPCRWVLRSIDVLPTVYVGFGREGPGQSGKVPR